MSHFVRILVLLSIFFVQHIYGQDNQRSINSHINDGLFSDTIKARGFLDKGKYLVASGRYLEAIEVTQKAKAIYTKYGLWENVIQSLIKLSILSDYFEDPKKKGEFAQEAINLSYNHIKADNALFALAYRQKAEASALISDLDCANYFLRLAIPVFKMNQVWSELGWCEIIMGVNFLRLGQLDSTSVHLQKVQNVLDQNVLSKTDAVDIQATFLNLLGIVYVKSGDYDRAIFSTQQALRLDLNKENRSKTDSLYIAGHYINLGAYFEIKGDYEQALDNFRQSVLYDETLTREPSLLNNIAGLMIRKEQFQESIKYLNLALKELINKREDLTDKINTYINLGVSYKELNLDEKAMFFCKKANELPIDYQKSKSWIVIGQIHLKRKTFSESIKSFKIALELFSKDAQTRIEDPFFKARIFTLIGDVYVQKNDPIIALQFYQKALIFNHDYFKDSLNIQSNPPLNGVYEQIYFFKTIHAKARVLSSFTKDLPKKKAALATYQLAIQWIDSLQAGYLTETSQLDWSSTYKPVYEQAIQVAFQLYQKTNDPKYLEQAFYFSEKSKNAILLRTLTSNEGKFQAGVPDSLIQKEKRLNLDIAYYEKSLLNAQKNKDSAKIELFRQYLSKTRLDLVDLRRQLENDFPRYHAWKQGHKITSIAEVQSKLLDEETALIEYFIGDSAAFVFLISPNKSEFFSLSSPVEINQGIRAFRKELFLFNPDSLKLKVKLFFENYHQSASHLYGSIFEPLTASLPKDIKKLMIIPDGLINTIPLEALTKKAEVVPDKLFSLLPYLIYDYEFAYAYSADLWLKNQERQAHLPANTNCLALAPPYAGKGSSAKRGNLKQLRGNLGTLEGAASEIKEIGNFYNGYFDFSESATKKKFKEIASQYGIIHLAMHGEADMKNSNFNQLIFPALAEDALEDTVLYHYEIANMELQAQLVVLSACETGVGKYEKGEGVFSLARSFMYAGVPSVVMSLWNVNDLSTSRLMPYFYEYLADGESKSTALHKAKQSFLKEELKKENIKNLHPFYWSTFVILGDSQEIKTDHSYVFIWGISILILLGIAGWFWLRNGKTRNV